MGRAEVWYAQLSSFHAAAAALITATGIDHLLLSEAHPPCHWSLAGGYVEAAEFPHDASARELQRNSALPSNPAPCWSCGLNATRGQTALAIISLTFDRGEISANADITLDIGELDAWAFLAPDEAATRLSANVAPRITAALRAHTRGKRRSQNMKSS